MWRNQGHQTTDRLVVALAQLEPARRDKGTNLQRAIETMHMAAKEGAGMVVFPEMFLTGFAIRDRAGLAESLDGPSMRKVADAAGRLGLVTLIGFPERSRGRNPFNSVCVVDADGQILGSYRKTHLFGREAHFFSAGRQFSAFDTAVGRIGVAICYDIEFPEVGRILAMRGAQIIAVPSANMKPYDRYHEVFARSRAMENAVYLAYTNTVGFDGMYEYFGESVLVDATGEIVCRGDATESVLVGVVDLSTLPPTDPQLRYSETRHPELYGEISTGPAVRRRVRATPTQGGGSPLNPTRPEVTVRRPQGRRPRHGPD